MQLLDESVVESSEIDSLGHMNVRYYLARMERANANLLLALGFDDSRLRGGFLQRADTYTRFLQEQFEGARLHTQGGVLSVSNDILKSYIEIRNPDSDAIAATFVVATQLTDALTRESLPLGLTAADVDDKSAPIISLPDYAEPRSLHLNPVRTNIAMDALEASIPEVEAGGMMSGKRNATIEEADVDSNGWLRADQELMFLPFVKLAAQTGVQPGPPVVHTPEGNRIGWAVMETRTLLHGQPKLGDELRYFSADIALEEKTRHSRRWAFDSKTKKLLGISDNIGLCIDLDKRRAVPWPDRLREQIKEHMRPQFGE